MIVPPPSVRWKECPKLGSRFCIFLMSPWENPGNREGCQMWFTILMASIAGPIVIGVLVTQFAQR